MSTTSASGQQGDGDRDDRPGAAVLWFVLVGLVGFALIVITRGWHDAFSQGETSVYLIGLGLAVVGETAIELVELGRSTTPPPRQPWDALRLGLRMQRTAGDKVGQQYLAGFGQLAIIAVSIVTGVYRTANIPGLSPTVTHVIWFFVGIVALAFLRFSVRRQPKSGSPTVSDAPGGGR